MVEHNARIASLASITLTPEQTIGASINWSIDSSLALPASALIAAARRVGLDESRLGDPTAPLSRFRDLHRDCRLSRPRGQREIVSTPARHDARHKVSYVYSVNVDHVGEERGRLLPLGSVTYDLSSEQMSWRYDCDARSQHESAEDYRARALASYAADPRPDESDLAAFEAHARASLDDCDRFSRESLYSGDTLRGIVSSYLRRVGGYLMTSRGGFWYLPRTGAVDRCPLTAAERMMQAIEEASSGQARFYRLTLPRDAASIETAGEIVRESLVDRLREIRERVAGVEAVSRRGQHSGRLEELAEIRSQISLYREILGILDGDLLADASAVESLIHRQTEELDGRREQAKAEKASTRQSSRAKPQGSAQELREAAEEPSQQTGRMGDSGERTSRLLERLSSSEMRIASGDYVRIDLDEPEGASVTIEEDVAFGLLWTVTRPDGTVAASGSATSVAHAAELLGRLHV
jgi:hypothetical protein